MSFAQFFYISIVMKKVVLVISILMLLVSCGQNSKGNYGATKIEFDETVFDFGSYSILEEREHVFSFTNAGNEPLVIQKAETSCACTQIDFSQEPVLPGKRGAIKIKYLARQKRGHFHRNVYVYSNGSEQPIRLTIDGEQH